MFGFVEFERHQDAVRAIASMEGFGVGGNQMRLTWGNHKTVRHGTVRCGTVRYGTVRYVRHGTVPYVAVRYGTVRYDTVRYGTVRYGTLRRGTVRYATITVRCSGELELEIIMAVAAFC